MHERWRAHLCGLCLTLRAESGQASRLLTGYDVLLLSVLVEAQAGPATTDVAGPCPLRAMRTATVVRADTPAMQVAAAGTLLTGAAGLTDKLLDDDLPRGTRRAARRAARRFDRVGRRIADRVGIDAEDVVQAAGTAAALEQSPNAAHSLEALLAPTGAVVAELFAATAHAAGRPDNGAALHRAGDAFGRLVHLGDAIDDIGDDAAHDRFNPLAATRTSRDDAARLALRLHEQLSAELAAVVMVDRELADVLFGPVLAKTVRGWQPQRVPAPRSHSAVAMAAMAAVTVFGVFGGPPRRRRRYYDDPRYDMRYDPRYDPGYDPRYDARYRGGYRRGPGCCDVLACDCCASMACSEMCGGDCCVCCV